MLHLEITADRDRLCNDGAVVENQRRHSLQRIDRRIFRRLVLHRYHVDLFGRYRDALLREENPGTARIRRKPAVIEFHSAPIAMRLAPSSAEHGQNRLSKPL